MLKFWTRRKQRKAIDDKIDERLDALLSDTETITELERLSELKNSRKLAKKPGPSWDTILMVGAQIAGILIITKHEQIDTLTSKALSWVPKGKL